MKKPATTPKGVPKTAEWDATTGAWEAGRKNARGRHGPWTAWRTDGSLFWKDTYRDGKRHGDRTYFEGGKLTMIQTYANGTFEGMKMLRRPVARKKTPAKRKTKPKGKARMAR